MFGKKKIKKLKMEISRIFLLKNLYQIIKFDYLRNDTTDEINFHLFFKIILY